MNYLELLIADMPASVERWAAGSTEPLTDNFIPASARSLIGGKVLIKIKDLSQVPRDLGTVITVAQARVLKRTSDYSVDTEQLDRDYMDFITDGATTRGETMTPDNINLVKYRERLILNGSTNAEADAKVAKMTARRSP